jgi:hypothetical protein
MEHCMRGEQLQAITIPRRAGDIQIRNDIFSLSPTERATLRSTEARFA